MMMLKLIRMMKTIIKDYLSPSFSPPKVNSPCPWCKKSDIDAAFDRWEKEDDEERFQGTRNKEE